MKTELLINELSKIENIGLRNIIENFIDEKVPDYIEKASASSSGKYHPTFDNGEGGLIRHLKMCVLVAEELLRLYEYQNLSKDVVICGCFMHDLFKNGNADCGHTVVSHDNICADEWHYYFTKQGKNIGLNLYANCEIIEACIREHMGQWGSQFRLNKHSYSYKECEVVAMCDYIASRKFFDLAAEL